ncbi:zinc finger and BTB domain-containing protein 22b [Mugil cephalus]|uniref:zinc finger and BTB domain-containing protein 22b n=1 Tax=Mugil cephalus TaxID=48193 RepID=UPI001FB78BB8|nr:zinc finger and BTB domain-containing protein 22b [Mugil cephalus]
MQSLAMEVGSSSSSSSSSAGSVVQVCFPSAQASVLDSLNRQREEGRLCDLSIHVQGQVFKAHRCVLAASSPYFHDQVLLKNMSTVSIPAVMDPLAFESVLSCAYTGQLRMLREDIVNYLTVGSVLQMWHIVDKCTELLKEGRAAAAAGSGGGGGGGSGGGGLGGEGRGGGGRGGGGVQDGASGGAANPGCSSSNGDGGAGGGDAVGGDESVGQVQVVESNEPQRVSQPPSRPSASESQSPSSTNYFSPRDGSGFGGSGAAATGASADGGGASNTPSYCTPSGGEEAFLIEEEEEEEEDVEEEEEEEVLYHQRKRGRGGGSRRRKKMSSASEQEVGVSDSFGVSSYQDGEDSALPLQKRPTYSQPSIMPRKQWVVVKTERTEDDDLIVVSGEEGGEDEEDEDEREMELARGRERSNFNISNVRSLSGEMGDRAENDMDSQDYCQSSEDYLKFEGSLMEQTLAQHLHDSAAGQNQNANRAVSALLGQVQSAASARAQLFPLDMQGNQILLYSQASGLSLDAAAVPPLGMAGGMIGGAQFKGPSLEHGAVHLSVQGGLGVDGMDGAGIGGGACSSGGSGKVFMCHCGKTFTHKSMRDRHINMHLDLRPFHCPVCAKKFKMKHHLTEHMKTHTGLKPYDCLGCGKKFMWRDSFMRHRSHCERRSGLGEGGEGASGTDGARRGGGGGGGGGGGSEDGPDFISSPHLLLSAGEGGQGGIVGGGARGGVSVSTLSAAVLAQQQQQQQQQHVSAAGSNNSSSSSGNMAAAGALLSPGQGQGSGMFGGLGLGRSVCDEDVCEVDESSVT